MRNKIPESTRKEVFKLWISGYTRDEIASKVGISGGSVSSIIQQFGRNSFDSQEELQALRELAVQCRKLGIPITELTSTYRLYSMIKRMGARTIEDVEIFVNNVYKGCLDMDSANSASPRQSPQDLVKLTNELYQLAASESISPAQVPNDIKVKFEERKRLDEAIKTQTESLNNIVLQTLQWSKDEDEIVLELEEFKQAKDILAEHNLNVKDIRMLVEDHRNPRSRLSNTSRF